MAHDVDQMDLAAHGRTPLVEMIRRYIFYGVFVLLAVLYVAIVPAFEFFGMQTLSGAVMKQIVLTAPFLLPQIPLLGELVPAVLGGIVAATAPTRARNTQLLLVLLLSAIVYFFYLHMSVFLGATSSGLNTPSLRNELVAQELREPDEALEVLRSFAASVRNFAAFVFAALIGIKFNDANVVAPNVEVAQANDNAGHGG